MTQKAAKVILVLKKTKKTISTIHEKRKSTNLAIMVEYTRISLGKYILVIRLLLPTSEFEAEVKLLTKKFQGSRPTVKKIIKGTPCDGTFKTTEKTKFITIS